MMTRTKTVATSLLALALATSALTACGGSSGGDSSGQKAEETVEQPAAATVDTAELSWSGYVMNLQLVSDSPDDQGYASDFSGKGVSIVFGYVSDEDSKGRFDGMGLFDLLAEHPITLTDSEGNKYESDGNLRIVNSATWTEFGLYYDVPADVALEDLTLSTGESEVQLSAYESPEFAEASKVD